MKLIVEAGLIPTNKLQDLMGEANQIIAMVVTSLKTLRSKPNSQRIHNSNKPLINSSTSKSIYNQQSPIYNESKSIRTSRSSNTKTDTSIIHRRVQIGKKWSRAPLWCVILA